MIKWFKRRKVRKYFDEFDLYLVRDYNQIVNGFTLEAYIREYSDRNKFPMYNYFLRLK